MLGKPDLVEISLVDVGVALVDHPLHFALGLRDDVAGLFGEVREGAGQQHAVVQLARPERHGVRLLLDGGFFHIYAVARRPDGAA